MKKYIQTYSYTKNKTKTYNYSSYWKSQHLIDKRTTFETHKLCSLSDWLMRGSFSGSFFHFFLIIVVVIEKFPCECCPACWKRRLSQLCFSVRIVDLCYRPPVPQRNSPAPALKSQEDLLMIFVFIVEKYVF